ncbi:hypothetical protein Taro_054101 [Colocasia esculenta]|uniref:Uncharacterized protein n=1 Tax=Colocasia esculenta TaxID=4460 RepID=A0A843XN09_COLES|nr:hypothetical protein [Colocasia esculenta]
MRLDFNKVANKSFGSIVTYINGILTGLQHSISIYLARNVLMNPDVRIRKVNHTTAILRGRREVRQAQPAPVPRRAPPRVTLGPRPKCRQPSGHSPATMSRRRCRCTSVCRCGDVDPKDLGSPHTLLRHLCDHAPRQRLYSTTWMGLYNILKTKWSSPDGGPLLDAKRVASAI